MSRKHPTSRRLGTGSHILITGVTLLIVLPVGAWAFLEKWWGSAPERGPITCTLEAGTFLHEILVDGTVECASNVEVESEADAIGFYTAMILEVVPEGTYVEPGDFLMQLDSSPLEELLVKRTIECNEREAALVKAEAQAETARIALEEYVDGLLPQNQQKTSNEVAVAREELRKAEQTLAFSESMYRQGFVTRIAVEADQFSADRAKLELAEAETKLHVLENYSSKMRLKQLESNLAVAEASVQWRRHVFELASKELDHIREQIGKCRITAPASGQVVYVNYERYGTTYRIEPGESVREHQVVFRLPNSDEMQAKVLIREDKVSSVHPGQPARVRFEAFPNVELPGVVKKVSEFPSPTNWWGPKVKRYESIVSIDRDAIRAAGVDLRPGLSAEVSIEVDRRERQLMLPFQAVLEHRGKEFCLTYDRSGFHAHEIETAATNGKFVIVRKGLDEGDKVVLGAANYRREVELPD